MSAKVITRTCTSTQVKVYGINPLDYASGVKSIDYLYNGDFQNATTKEIELIKESVKSDTFIPAQVVSEEKSLETKYAMTFDDYIKLSHIVQENEKLTNCITRTIRKNTLYLYGVNIINLDKVEKIELYYYGDYSKISRQEKERLIDNAGKNGFYPAYIKLVSTIDEKRALTLSEYIKHAHVANDDEIEE